MLWSGNTDTDIAGVVVDTGAVLAPERGAAGAKRAAVPVQRAALVVEGVCGGGWRGGSKSERTLDAELGGGGNGPDADVA